MKTDQNEEEQQSKAMRCLERVRRYGSRFRKLALKYAMGQGQDPVNTLAALSTAIKRRRAAARAGCTWILEGDGVSQTIP